MRSSREWILTAFVLILAACGGGGGGGSTPAGGNTGGGTPPPVGTVRLVSATAEKGPFVIGSSVSVNKLDNQAQPTASTLTTETDDNLGNFSFSIEPGPVSISVDGFHFNEITGSLANGRLTLRAIYEVQDTESQRAHVNLLTHLIHLRVEELVQAGSSIPAAVQTAQTELTAQLSPIFGAFSPDNFANYSVYASDSTSSDGAAYILAVSAAIYQSAINRGGTDGFDAELALIVNNLSDDFADGVIDLQWILDGIDAASAQIDPAQLSANLLSHAASVGFTAEPADASSFIDTDRDGVMNAIDDDDDNDGVLDLDDPFPLDSSESSDFDNDGIGDNTDPDDDNDGTPDSSDPFPLDPSEDTDTDGDGIGNNADPDDDNDGVLDLDDPFPLDSSESSDFDNDGIGDNADPDDDNDGTPDSSDAFPLDPAEDTDTDGDGIGNNADPDDDNDGIPDADDPAPLSRPPVILGELPRYVISGLEYQNFLEATDPDGDYLDVWAEGGPFDPGSSGVSIWSPGADPGTVLPPPQFEGHTVNVMGYPVRLPGVYPLTITVTDGTDFTVYETDLEVVAAADAPVLESHPPTVGFRGEAYSGALKATNPRGTDLVWSLESGPDWLSIDPATGELSGTIPVDHRLPAALVQLEGFSPEQQLEWCRMKQLVVEHDSCPVDTIGIGIDDGTIKATWVVHIDLFDAGEVQGPVVDGNTFHQVLADAVFTDSQDFSYTVGTSGFGIDGNNGLGLDDVFIKKLDSRQVEQWTRIVGSNGIDRVVSSVMDVNEDIYLYIYSNGDWRPLVGDSSNPTSNKRFIVKVSASGQISWAVELADSTDVVVEELPEEIYAPHLAAMPGGGVRVFVNGELLDVDALGNVSSHLSTRFPWPIVWRIAVASDGSTIIASSSNLTRLDASGAELWTIELDTDPEINWSGRSIAFDSNGDIIVSGDGFRNDLTLYGSGWFLARYAEVDGSQMWFHGSPFTDDNNYHDIGPNGLTVDTSGNIIVAGKLWRENLITGLYDGKFDTVNKFDPSGNLLWYQKLWYVDSYKYMSVVKNSADDLIVVGGGSNTFDFFYLDQLECSGQGPCSRGFRVASNDYAMLKFYTGNGANSYYLVTLDTNGAEK